MLVYDTSGVSDTLSTTRSCSVLAAAAATATLLDCTLTLTKDVFEGAHELPVTAADQGFTFAVPFRVWAPTDVSVAAVDRVLNAVAGASAPGDCDRPQYQQTPINAVATWSTGEMEVEGVVVRLLNIHKLPTMYLHKEEKGLLTRAPALAAPAKEAGGHT
eukprot:291414-Prorocentrum_minimum.AAC.4